MKGLGKEDLAKIDQVNVLYATVTALEALFGTKDDDDETWAERAGVALDCFEEFEVKGPMFLMMALTASAATPQAQPTTAQPATIQPASACHLRPAAYTHPPTGYARSTTRLLCHCPSPPVYHHTAVTRSALPLTAPVLVWRRAASRIVEPRRQQQAW